MSEMSDDAKVRAIVRFNWKNEDWADTWLPTVRVAAWYAEYDGQADGSEIGADWGQDWREAREHLLSMVAILDDALARAQRGSAH